MIPEKALYWGDNDAHEFWKAKIMSSSCCEIITSPFDRTSQLQLFIRLPN
jgi:hypothetical protein